MERYKKLIILFSLLAVGIIVISVIFALKDDTKKGGKDKNTGNENSGNVVKDINGTLMMLTNVDLDSSNISMFELETGEEHTVVFTGGSDIRTKNMRVISAAYLQKGNIALVDFDENDRLISLIGSDRVWTYKNINKIKIDTELGRMELGGNVYRLANNYKVLNEGDFVPLDSLALNGTDMINLYGIDNNVYLIKVSSGHGYLVLDNYDDFLEGNIYYGMGKCETVTENLRLMLPEGEQEITVQKDGETANAVVRIVNNEETCFDLEGYGPDIVEYREVTFNILPQGSLLYIDGVKTDYQKPVSVTQGFHQIEVELGGYNSYKGSIEADTDGMVKNISLSPQPTAVPDDILYEDFNESENGIEDGSSEDNSSGNGSNDTVTTGTPGIDDVSAIDIPDNTSVSSEDGEIEVIDGDKSDDSQENSQGNGHSGSSSDNITIVGDNDREDESGDVRDSKQYSGDMTIYCSEGTEIYIDDIYKGRVSNGSLTTPKPIGTIELKLVKKGYVTKRYTLTMDAEEESSVFKFPDMTPES